MDEAVGTIAGKLNRQTKESIQIYIRGEGKMKAKKYIALALAALMALGLTACGKSGRETEVAERAKNAHAPITIMSANKDYSGFIEYVKSVYPEINIEIVPYRGANTTQYMYDQLYTGYMPDIYATTQLFTCYDKYAENLIDLSKYDFTSRYNEARISQYELDGKIYLLPTDYDVIGIVYNASLFEREGWKVPESFAELEELAPVIEAAGYTLSDCATNLPGFGFQYLCNIADTKFLRSIEGIRWQRDFLAGKATAVEGLAGSFDYIQKWVDLGMLKYSSPDEAPHEHFKEGNTAFFVGSIYGWNTRDDGTGDVIKPLPYLSEDGTQNMFISSTVRAYGLSRKLEAPGNEQKLEDALKVMELLSTDEGMMRIMERYETASARVCSLKDWEMPESSPYYDYRDFIADGHVAPLIYAGWENIMVDVGNIFFAYLRGDCTAMDVLTTMDACQAENLSSGAHVYAQVEETLEVEDLARLTGMVFCEAAGADLALISLNEWKAGVSSRHENADGIGGEMMPVEMTEMDIVCWLPTGWYGTIQTYTFTGARIRELAERGYDLNGDGNSYPYVLVAPEGFELDDAAEYTVYFAGIAEEVTAESEMQDSGIVGLEAMEAYLDRVEVTKPADIFWEA